MGGHGKTAWPLRVPLLLCVVLSLVPGRPRAEALSLKAAPEFASAAAALDPVNYVLARGDIAAAARSALQPETAPAPATSSRNALMRLFFQDSSEERGLQVAPIRWRGSLGFEQRLLRSSGGARRSQSIELASVQMASFVGQPWLAQVSANLGILTQQQRAGGAALAGAADSERSASLTGGATVAIFPSSRFPFTARFESNDSRASGEATASDHVNRVLALRQSYRSPLGDQVYGASLERSTLISSSFGRDSVTSLNGTLQRSFALQSLDVSGSLARNRRSTGEDSGVSRLSAHHSYRPTDLLTVNSYASFSMNDLSAGAAGLRSRFVQVNSFATWRPDEESPLYVTGGVRVADASLGAGNGSAAARSAGANLAMSYALGDHANVVAAASVDHVRSEQAAGIATTQSVAANYGPPARDLGPVAYSWTTSASVSNQTGGTEGRQHGLGAQVSHQVSRGLAIGTATSVNATLNQAVSVQDDSIRDVTTTVLHSGSLGVRINPHPASDAFANLSAGESRSRGGREDRFRLLNLQLSGQLQLGAYSLVTANFTLQAIRQRLPGEEGSRTSMQRSGTLGYQHSRLFGVRRLRLVASATFNDMQLGSRLLGDVDAPRDQYTRIFEQSLLYDIGRLEFRLGTRLATLEGRSDRQFFFRLNRQFGLY